MDGDLNILVRDRGDNRYVFIFTDSQATEVLRYFGRFASDPDLNWTWWDTKVMGDEVRKLVANETGGARRGAAG